MFRSGTAFAPACPEVLALVPCPSFDRRLSDPRWLGGGLAMVLAAAGAATVWVWGTGWGALPFAIQMPGLETSGLTRWDDLVSWLSGLVGAFGAIALGWAWWDASGQRGATEDRRRARDEAERRVAVWRRLVVEPGTGRIVDPISQDTAPPLAAAVQSLIDRQADTRFRFSSRS